MDKKKQGRRRNALMYIPIATLLTLILTVFGVSVFLRITDIVIVGATYYTEEEIIAAAGVGPGENLLLVNGAEVARRIMEELTYISEVQTSNVLPGTLRIYIRESTPIAQIVYRGRFLAIDATGRVLSDTASGATDAISVRGAVPISPGVGRVLQAAPGAEIEMDAMMRVLSAIYDAGLIGATVLDVANPANITLEVFLEEYGHEWHFMVELGSLDGVSDRIRPLPDVIELMTAEIRLEGAVGRLRFQTEREQWIFVEEFTRGN